MAITNKYNYVYQDDPERSDLFVESFLNALSGANYSPELQETILNNFFGKPAATSAAVAQPTSTVAAATTPASTVTQPVTTQTFSDQITAGTPTTQDEFLSAISTPAGDSTAATTKLSAKPTAAELQALYKTTGVSTPTTVTTEQGDQTVYNPIDYGDGTFLWETPGAIIGYEGQGEGSTPIYAQSTLGGYSKKDGDYINFYDLNGNLVERQKWNKSMLALTWDDLGPIITTAGMQYLGGIPLGDTGLTAANAVNAAKAINSGNWTSLLANTANALPGSSVNLGGYTAKDALSAANFINSAQRSDVAGMMSSAAALTGSSDLKLAAAAARMLTAADSGDYSQIFNAATGLTQTLSGSGSSKTTGTTGADISTLSAEDLAELSPGELKAYQESGITGLATFRKDMKLLNSLTGSGYTGDSTGGTYTTDTGATTVSGLPTGLQLASLGDGVFRTDVGGTPIYAESKNAGTVSAPFGYSLLSAIEADNKPAGSYYDPTANAWFKPDVSVSGVTGSADILSDLNLFNSTTGDLDTIAASTAGSSDDSVADFLRSIGITNTTQLADSGLSNQDILDMINAANDTVTVTGAKGNDTITGANGNDNLDTVTITGAKGNDTVTGVDTIKGADGNDLVVDDKGTVTIVDKKESCPIGTVLNPETGECDAIQETLTCPPGKVLNDAGTACIDEVIIKDKKDFCPVGTVLNPETGECDPVIDNQKLECPVGYEPNEAGTACIPVVTITDKKCDPGYVYDEDLKMCVPITVDEACPTGFHKDESGKCVPDTKDDLKCPEGYEPNDAGTACIPIIEIVDKKCPPGQVYDEDLKMCVPIKEEECPTGYHRDPATGACVPDEEKCKPGFHKDASGACVPDEVKCETGYHLENGVCVKDTLSCPEGYELNEAGTECIPVVVIKDKKCQPGYVYDEDLKMCVPVKEDTCPIGFHKDESGKCVPDESKLTCPPGYELNEAGTECIPVIEIKDKKCDPGYVYDEELKQCVPIKTEECKPGFHLENGVCVKDKLVCAEGFELNEAGTECIPVVKITECKEGFHRDETGACVPDTVECGPGYHLENGVCVKDALECPEGYELNESGTECIPVVKITECKEGFHRDETGACVPNTVECGPGYHLENGQCVKDKLECPEGYELNDAGTECIPVLKVESCKEGYHRNAEGVCVPDTEECAEGFHLEDGICVPDDDEKCQDGYEKFNGTCVPVCQEGYIRNLETGTCEKPEDKSCPVGQARNAEGKCVPIVQPPPPPVQCPVGFKLVNGACVPITTVTPNYTTSGYSASGEKTDPIYAGGMDAFNLLATLEQLLNESSAKKDTKETKQKTKMASGGHLDDLLAEQMTVDDLLKLLR